MEKKLRNLKLKKAKLIDQMLMLSSISDHFYIQLGKLEVDILLLDKKILSETKNDLDES